MKKSNFVPFLSLCVIIVVVILFMLLWKNPSSDSGVKSESTSERQSGNILSTHETTGNNYSTEIPTYSNADSPVTDNITANPNNSVSMDDALFIGDSRTVGLMEYAGIDGADYFCTVGMSVYNIHKKPVSVPNVGKVTLTELLNGKKYGKIYIMLGINEVGYELSSTVEKYRELLEFIEEKQPDAVIFVQANLHVSKSRSDSDKVINNVAINRFNGELAKLTDGKRRFYLDANVLFDDETGGLSADKSEDSTHLYAKYYKEWGEWIVGRTAALIGE